MIDKETDAVESTEVSDDQLEQATGGFMVKPAAPSPPKLKVSGDPCEGGE